MGTSITSVPSLPNKITLFSREKRGGKTISETAFDYLRDKTLGTSIISVPSLPDVITLFSREKRGGKTISETAFDYLRDKTQFEDEWVG